MVRWLSPIFGTSLKSRQRLLFAVSMISILLWGCQPAKRSQSIIDGAPENGIIGGESVVDSQFAKGQVAHAVVSVFVVTEELTPGNFNGFTCTGTLIDSQWVLTAAHCLKHVREKNAEQIYITPNTKTISVDALQGLEYFIHPDYKGTDDADLALIKIPALNRDEFEPMLLASDEIKLKGVQDAFLIGYGRNDGSNPKAAGGKGILRWAVKKIGAQNKSAPFFDLESTDGIGTCSGDSGSPLLVSNAEGTFIQIGVLHGSIWSWSAEKTKDFQDFQGDWVRYVEKHPDESMCGGKSHFTNILLYRSWISETLRNHKL